MPHHFTFIYKPFNIHNCLSYYLSHSQNCFSSPYFMACLDALTLSDEQKTYESYIERIHAPTPVE